MSVYDDVAVLQQQMTQAQAAISEAQTAIAALQSSVQDSGWLNLTLAEGIQVYANTQIPQYRRVGNTVFIRGAVKNVTATGVVAILPTGFRTDKTISFVQNTSLRTGNFAMFARYTINSSGEIRLEAVSDGAAIEATKWFPIHTVFEI